MSWFRNTFRKEKKETQPQIPWTPRAVLRTHTGHVRDHNEDALIFYTTDSANGTSPVLAIVADGMGGHAAGEVASRICIETFVSLFQSNRNPEPSAFLSSAIQNANRNIFSSAEQNENQRGMGTTCSALMIAGNTVWVANVGDSRTYQYVAGVLSQLTTDDTVVNQWVAEGRISKEEAAHHPDANILTQALGTKPEVRCTPKRIAENYKPGDRLLICSDGLYDMVEDSDIAKLLEMQDAEKCADALIDLALRNGGRDNVSVILIECLEKNIQVNNSNKTGIHQIQE